MTLLIIAGCGAAFWWELRPRGDGLHRAIGEWGFVPAALGEALRSGDKSALRHALATVFTCQFLHAGWLHILGNLWTLWIFGDNVEDRLGRFKFLGFYLVCGAVAAIVQGMSSHGTSVLPMIGASGAIAGVMGAYLVWCWTARVTLLVPIAVIPLPVKVPAVLYLLGWIGLQWLAAVEAGGRSVNLGGVAWWAHIGGFTCGVVGAILIRPLEEREVVRG